MLKSLWLHPMWRCSRFTPRSPCMKELFILSLRFSPVTFKRKDILVASSFSHYPLLMNIGDHVDTLLCLLAQLIIQHNRLENHLQYCTWYLLVFASPSTSYWHLWPTQSGTSNPTWDKDWPLTRRKQSTFIRFRNISGIQQSIRNITHRFCSILALCSCLRFFSFHDMNLQLHNKTCNYIEIWRVWRPLTYTKPIVIFGKPALSFAISYLKSRTCTIYTMLNNFGPKCATNIIISVPLSFDPLVVFGL